MNRPNIVVRPREGWRAGKASPVDEVDEVVMYCGSGVTACVNLLALERAGLPGARLFAGSWSEWSQGPDRPIEK